MLGDLNGLGVGLFELLIKERGLGLGLSDSGLLGGLESAQLATCLGGVAFGGAELRRQFAHIRYGSGRHRGRSRSGF